MLLIVRLCQGQQSPSFDWDKGRGKLWRRLIDNWLHHAGENLAA
jgi:hypothetical protein